MAKKTESTGPQRAASFAEGGSDPVPEGTHLLPPGKASGGMPGARSPLAKAPKPPTAKQTATIRTAAAKRDEWEHDDVGRERTKDISTHYQEKASQALGRPAARIPAGMIYELHGRPSTGIGPGMHDVQLPGMSDPSAAPRPPRWEELPPETRAHTERALAANGTSLSTMQKDVGAQHDQAKIRADSHGADLPHATNFYSSGEPRKVIDASARELGIPQPIHAAMNAITSPNTKFSQTSSAGEKVYPNNEAAVHVVKHVQGGGTHENIDNMKEKVPGPGPAIVRHQGYVTNLRKAALGFEHHLNGVPMENWRGKPSISRPEGTPMMGPKTGPYANSWSDTHPQFFVSDVHSGGGGFLPHLGATKPIMLDEEGNHKMNEATGKPKRDKSEREKAMASIPYFHSAADYAARGAMAERGLTSTRDFQATQWGEEQIQRGARHGADADAVYQRPARSVDKKQGRLF